MGWFSLGGFHYDKSNCDSSAPMTRPMPTAMILPGSTVRVINAQDTYYGFEGQVQRVAEGHAAVIL